MAFVSKVKSTPAVINSPILFTSLVPPPTIALSISLALSTWPGSSKPNLGSSFTLYLNTLQKVLEKDQTLSMIKDY